jgi:pimeloyl-ACP methyl ester carboxylesterase
MAYPAPCKARPDTLLVMLPGSYSLPEEFVSEGFVKAVRDRQLAVDVLLVDAHVGYYDNRTIVTRLGADVIQPARAQGYRHIWLAGISIGGVGAMLYADARPDDVDGVVVLAPYLGTRLTAQEIKNAGSLAAWPAPLVPPEGDVDVSLWRWLQAQTSPAFPGKKIPLFLGYGLDDRFVFNARVLSAELPPPRVFTTEGGHDWPAWRPLWQRVVQALPISQDEACARPPGA